MTREVNLDVYGLFLAVMSVNGDAVALSEDHKPNVDSERERIEAAGGKVKKHGKVYRINNDLAVSRGFGDIKFKNSDTLGERLITVEPDVTMFEVDPKETDFILVACDGIWDVLDNDECVEIIQTQLEQEVDNNNSRNDDLYYACMALSNAAAERGSKDNVTCILIALDEL